MSLNKSFTKEILQNILNKYLNDRLVKLENSTKGQMHNLNKTSKNFKEFSKNIQQITNNILEQTVLFKENQEKKEENKNNNENILRQSINDITSKNTNNKSSIRNRSNTLGISKYNQLKKQNTEVNLAKGSFISNNNNNSNNKPKSKLKSPEKNNKSSKMNITKDLAKNSTPKKTNKIDFFIEGKVKFPQTEKIPKKMKKINTNKNVKYDNKNKYYINEFENIFGENKNQMVNSFKKEKKVRNQKESLKTNKSILNDNYIKKEIILENKINDNNFNNLKASFTSKRGKKLTLNENNIFKNNTSDLTDIQNIVKLVDNVNQNITKILNGNNSPDFSLINNLRNSNKISFENNLVKKNEFALKKKYLSKKEQVKNINVLEIFKKDNNIVKNILKYLPQKETIYFYSINNYFNKGRITFFDNKKEELLSILNLKKDETIENKINEIKNKFTEEELSHKKKFEITQETSYILKKINKEDYLKKLKNLEKNENIFIIYKILFILLGEENIYNTLNKDIFFKKCLYFFENSPDNLGDFILEKIPELNFEKNEFNMIENLIKDNKNEIINEISNSKKSLIIPLIKEFLEYIGIIFSENKTEGSIYINNLRKNQIIINYLNNLKVRYFLSKYNEEDDED
jgi:hypothetical protein